MSFMDSVSVTEFPDNTGYPLLNIKLLYIILLILYIVPTVIGFIHMALSTSKKIDKRQYQIGFKILAIAALMFLATFISDSLQATFIDHVGVYAFLLYLTWVFPLAACSLLYIGYVMPGWFSKYFKETGS